MCTMKKRHTSEPRSICNTIFICLDSLKSLQLRASSRGSSTCWVQALQTLVESCKSMDENLRSKFAVQLANCHLQSSGLKTVPCKYWADQHDLREEEKKPQSIVAGTASMSVLECTAPLAENPIAFNSYTEFFIHSDHVRLVPFPVEKGEKGKRGEVTGA